MRRIRLGNAVFEGRNDVYLLGGEDDETTALVDAGVSTPAVREELREGLAAHGLSFADVDELFLTHWHSDHSGLAGEIQAAGGATVRAHEADAPLVAHDPDALAAERDLERERFAEWGIPDEARAELTSFLDESEAAGITGEPADVTPFADGATFGVNGLELEAVHLPGHAAGLTAFAFETDGRREAFVGDAILPKYTPNVGGADVRVDRPLERYAESLVRIADRGWARAWPGHRDPIDDPTGRAAEILDHHRERTRRVVGVLRERDRADPWTVSADLFGDLSGIHILHGPGEAYAHLDHLAARGVAARDGREYELLDSDPDVAALFPRIDREG